MSLAELLSHEVSVVITLALHLSSPLLGLKYSDQLVSNQYLNLVCGQQQLMDTADPCQHKQNATWAASEPIAKRAIERWDWIMMAVYCYSGSDSVLVMHEVFVP